RGVKSPETAVPAFPMLYNPRAKPRISGLNQPLKNGTPMANEAPATPSRIPTTNNAGNDWTKIRLNTGTAVKIHRALNINRPPYRSVKAPATIRPIDPTNTGAASKIAKELGLSVNSYAY